MRRLNVPGGIERVKTVAGDLGSIVALGYAYTGFTMMVGN